MKRKQQGRGSMSEIESGFRAVVPSTDPTTHEPMSFRDRLDAVVTWNGMWSAIRRLNYRFGAQVLRALNHDSGNVALLKRQRRLDAILPILDGSVTYRRRMTFAMVRKAAKLRAAGLSDATIRALTVGRVLRDDGAVLLPTWRRRTLTTLGWLWRAITLTVAALLLTLVWARAGDPIAKVLVTIPLAVFFLFCWLYMDAITLRAMRAVQDHHDRLLGKPPTG
jgi:hypothetical protein